MSAKVKKASLDRLYKLHSAIAEYYIEAAESDEELSSGTLAAINGFLKMNGITVDVIEEENKSEDFISKLRLLASEGAA